jgi:acetone carboxylase gamma subunit
MATANEDIYDRFLESRGHEPDAPDWERDHKKKRCPECMGLHELEATACGVCGWEP